MNNKIDIPQGWEIKKLGEVVEINNTKVGNEKLEALSISAGIGFVNQANKFGRDLSGNQYSKYIKILKNDFAYNKGNSKKYPQGCIYLLKDRKMAAIPNVFECFRFINQINEYYEQLFMSGFLNQQLQRLINFGVRNDGLLNLTSNNFYNVLVPIPPLEEQKKIADILLTWDKAITTLQEIIQQKELQKKGLMQNLLTGKKRLNGFNDEWKEVKLGEVCEINSGKLNANRATSIGNYIFFTYDYKNTKYINQYFWDKEALIICKKENHEDCCRYYNGKFNAFQWMRILHSFKEIANIHFIKYYINFSFINFLKTYSTNIILPYIAMDDIKEYFVPIPTIEEQKAIAEILMKADEEIELLNKQLELYTEQKKGLMQKLLTGKIRVN